MREILFRGKTKRNEWIYGDLITHGIDFDYAIKQHHTREVWDIIPETVGQFTGLTDKNGTKIFEGDIVAWYSELVVIKFGEYDAIEQSYEIGNHFRKVDKFGWFGERQNCCSKGIEFILLKDGEVIGNIYDNPELLKELQNER